MNKYLIIHWNKDCKQVVTPGKDFQGDWEGLAKHIIQNKEYHYFEIK